MTCYQFTPRGDAILTVLRHLPQGAAWITWRMPGKTARKLMDGIAAAFEAASEMICTLARELDPRTTEEMIGEWESALALPDACLPEAATLAERRAWVLWRLDKRRWSTAQDWHDLAALFDLEIAITPGWKVQEPALYPMDYPRRYDLFPKLGRFRVYINVIGLAQQGYDYGEENRGPGYPIPYGYEHRYTDFQCLIERVKPANVVVIWNWPLETIYYDFCLSETFEATFSEDFC